MKVAVTTDVREQAESLFSPAEAMLVCAELADADLPLINNNGERVHRSILSLSRGDLAQFREHLALAKIDWRDVLVAARGY